MGSRYAQVIRSYGQPWGNRFALLGAVAFMAIASALSSTAISPPRDYAFRLGTTFIAMTFGFWIGGGVTEHVKRQLMTPYASLAPRFRGPHLLVAAIVILAATLTVARVAHWSVQRLPFQDGSVRYALSFIGLLAATVTVTVPMAWVTQLQSVTIVYIWMA